MKISTITMVLGSIILPFSKAAEAAAAGAAVNSQVECDVHVMLEFVDDIGAGLTLPGRGGDPFAEIIRAKSGEDFVRNLRKRVSDMIGEDREDYQYEHKGALQFCCEGIREFPPDPTCQQFINALKEMGLVVNDDDVVRQLLWPDGAPVGIDSLEEGDMLVTVDEIYVIKCRV